MRSFINSWARSAGLFILFFIALSACDIIKVKGDKSLDVGEEPVARVMEHYLYPSDLKGIVPKGTLATDSASRVERYVDSWIRKQLMVGEANRILNVDQADLERRVLDYRYAILIHEYEQLKVNEQLNTRISDEEINQYYEEEIDNFKLKQNIIRGNFVKVAREAPDLKILERVMRARNPDKEELADYCNRYANFFYLEDSSWVNFDEVIRGTPYLTIPNKIQFLRNNKFAITEDSTFFYYLRIFEYKISDQISPLEFVRNDVKQIILNKRKVTLTKKLEEDVYRKASENRDFEVYGKE